MARTPQQIYDAMALEKHAQSVLAGLQPDIDVAQDMLDQLSTTSNVGKWRLNLWVVAVAQSVLENLWDLFQAEVQAIVDAAIPGTARWYRDQLLKFQYGDALVWLNNKFQYATINTSIQIIKFCAVVESGGQVIIKVAKSVSGVITPLSGPELTAAGAYVVDIRFAGTETVVQSNAADQLKLAVKAYYDPLVIAADGSLISNSAVFPLEDAINSYIANLPFNGLLTLTFLEDAMQQAVGIVNPIITDAEAKYGALPYAVIVERYLPDAGYLVIDGSYPLATQIAYVASV